MAMISEETLQGYVLEEILARLLKENGYALLVQASQDEDALREGKHGLLVRGRGTDHQADALGELLLPSPFSLPIRLFAEAKFRKSAIGISDVRNALGVLNDVNERYASDTAHGLPMRRYQYRYCLFSTSGFTADAQKYALAHQISLIDLQGPAFADLRGIASSTAGQLLRLAKKAKLESFPLQQMRSSLRMALRTWNFDSDRGDDETYESARIRASSAPTGAAAARDLLPIDEAARIAASLSEELTDELIIGFPQGPFILVLQPDNPIEFSSFLENSPAEVDVDIRFGSATGTKGEWVIVPAPGREELVARFGIPPLLETWLLQEDEGDLERLRLAKKTFFSTIAIFHHSNRLTQLRYRRVGKRKRTTDEVLAEPVSELRQELAEPDLAFERRAERFDEDLDENPELFRALQERSAILMELDPSSTLGADEVIYPPEDWTAEGVSSLLRQLDRERPLQAEVIRFAARRNGSITRRQVYRLGRYDPNRSLRGFTRPSNRVTRELQKDGVVGLGVQMPLRPIFGKGGVAQGFELPPEITDLLGATEV